MTGDLADLSQRAAIRAALAQVGDDPAAAVAWLAEHGRPGVARQRVYDVIRVDGRPIGKPRPPAAQARKRAAPRPGAELARLGSAWDAQAPPRSLLADLEGVAEGEACVSCGGPLQWTGARTAVACPACLTSRISRGALRRAAEIAEQWAPARQGNRAPSPAERDQAAADAAEARDRIAGYRETLALIPRRDRYRGPAARALHYLDQLDSQYGAAASADDIAAAGARETELVGAETGTIDDLLTYGERLAAEARDAEARRARREDRHARRAPLIQLGRSPDGAYGYGDDQAAEADYDDQADDAEQITPSAPLCEKCYAGRTARPATMRVDPHGHDGQQGVDVCDSHSRDYPASVQVVATYQARPELAERAGRLGQLGAGPAPLAIEAPAAPVMSIWDRVDRIAERYAERTGGRRP